ncbi:anthocyanidin 3-O-glucosyltransferase 5-like protein [Tanacetum coccineum]
MIHEDGYAELFQKEDAENRYVSIGMAGVKKETLEVSFKLHGFIELKIKGDGVTKDFKHVKYEGRFNLPRNVTNSSIVSDMNDGELK